MRSGRGACSGSSRACAATSTSCARPGPNLHRRAAAGGRHPGHHGPRAVHRGVPGNRGLLREGTAADMLELLESDAVDAAFSLIAGEVPAGIEALELSEEGVVVAFPPGTAPATDRVSASDLAGVPLATPARARRSRRPRTSSSRAGEQLRLSLESGDPYLIRCLVSDGFGAAPARVDRSPGGPAGRDASAEPGDPPAGLPALAHRAPPLRGGGCLHRLRARVRLSPARRLTRVHRLRRRGARGPGMSLDHVRVQPANVPGWTP